MIFLPEGNRAWKMPLVSPVVPSCALGVWRNGKLDLFKLVEVSNPTDLAEGQFTFFSTEFPELGYTHDLSFVPMGCANPNLDELDYYLIAEGSSEPIKWGGRRVLDIPVNRRFDFFAEPKTRDFAESFWRNHADGLHPIGEAGRSAICYGIAHSGAGSLFGSIANSGWWVGSLVRDHRYHLRGMHALSAGARDLPVPDYPPLVFSHFPGQSGAVIPGAGYYCLLRDPIRRLVSYYHYGVDTGEQLGSLDRWVDRICAEGWDDWQMKWLANLSGALEMSLVPWGLNPFYCKVTASGMRMSENLIDGARRGLERLFFVGITECFDESLCLASLLMRSRYVGLWPMRNRSSASDGYSLSDAARRKLEAYAEPEIILYQDMKQNFEERYREELSFIRSNIQSLKMVEA